jgi:hypothetical protein
MQALSSITSDLVKALPSMFNVQLMQLLTSESTVMSSTAREATVAPPAVCNSSSGSSSSSSSTQSPSVIGTDMIKGRQLNVNVINARLRTSMEQLVTDASVAGAAQRPAAWMPTNEELVGMMTGLTKNLEDYI